MFEGKNILVGVTGGIAAYKSAYLVRELKKNKADVRVMMTESAQRFVSPLTFETLSENKVAIDLFGDENSSPTAHIEWARWPDIIVISPATANTIGKIANGIADNLVTTTLLATTEKVLLCPAMNVEMYNNFLFQQNVEKLTNAGFEFVQPDAGELACGEVGMGRLAEPQHIVEELKYQLLQSNELRHKKILISAGPTFEAIDPVRHLTNRSSGKMGYALAEEAAMRGAQVTLVSGPTMLPELNRVNRINVKTAVQMATEVKSKFDNNDVVIMAAAVADYKPAKQSQQKVKKSNKSLIIEFEPTEDILATLGRQKSHQFLVGFALETNNGIEHAIEKLQRKKCDIIVLNNPLEEGAGFELDTNKITLIDKNKMQQDYPVMSKKAAAKKILDAVQLGLQ